MPLQADVFMFVNMSVYKGISPFIFALEGTAACFIGTVLWHF